ncbi:hypothetical protein J0S82_013486, partial [Galemys pyrenaicus]
RQLRRLGHSPWPTKSPRRVGVQTENNGRINLKEAGQAGPVGQSEAHTTQETKKAHGMTQSDSDLTGNPSMTQTPAPLGVEDGGTADVFRQRGGVCEKGTRYFTPELCSSRPRRHPQKTATWFHHILTTT